MSNTEKEKPSHDKYKDLVEQIDRIFPWYFLSVILFFSSFVGSTTALVVYLRERPAGLFMAIFVIFIPFYTSLFSITILTRIYRNRFRIQDYIIFGPRYSVSASSKITEEEREYVDRMYEKTKNYLSTFPIFMFACFAVLLIVIILMLLLPPVIGSW